MQQGKRGARTPGWEEYNLERLALDLGVTPDHLRYALTGKSNTTLELVFRVGRALGLSPAVVVGRIERQRGNNHKRKTGDGK